MATVVEFRLLGPVELWLDGHPVATGYPRQRCALAALLADLNRVVSTPTLVGRLWGEQPPPSARNVVAGYVSRLRRLLARVDAVRIAHRSGGYSLLADPELVDLYRFRNLVAEAGGTDEPTRREALLRDALALWQGTALADLSGAWCTSTRQAWEHERLAARLAHHEAQLRLGAHAELVPRLAGLLTEHPLDERLARQLMVATYRSGDQAAAIEHYQRLRARLADELGVDPGPHLRHLYEQILRNDPALDAPPAPTPAPTPRFLPAAPPPADTAVIAAQLPPDIAGFTGRVAELARLDALLETLTEQPTTMLVVALVGTAGVGKTALALHWAHRVADRFPDGQLYVNLRGFDPSAEAMTPAEAVRRFLDALGAPPQRIPTGLDAQVDLYRSLLAGRRMLVVLDNAATVEQVRPLLPGAAGCVTLVTSRNALTGLVIAEAAHPITLDLLSAEEASDLLAHRLGAARTTGEPAATADIVTACAGLPLALAIAAARAATRPQLPLAAVTDELRDARARLAVLADDDPHCDLRAVFSWSYQALPAPAARLFRLLGLHPGPDVTAPAAASLTGHAPSRTRALLTALTRANLLIEHAPGRYTCHDLLRTYATDLTHEVDRAEQRRGALGRMLDHYVHTAHAANRLLNPIRDPIQLPLAPPRPGVTVPALTDHRHAMEWFAAEHRILMAAATLAVQTGFDRHAWQLTWSLDTFLDRRGQWLDRAAVLTTALTAARRLADPSAQAHAHRNLAIADVRLGQLNQAHTHLRKSLALSVCAGDLIGQGHTLVNIAYLHEQQGRHHDALHHCQRALALYRKAEHRRGQAAALNAIGWYHAQLGDHEAALTVCNAALALHQQLNHRDGEAATWDSLGYANQRLGRHPEAVECYHRALDLFGHLGDRYNQAATLTNLGQTHHDTGNPYAARQAWRRALTILDDLGHPNAEALRTKLGPPAGGHRDRRPARETTAATGTPPGHAT